MQEFLLWLSGNEPDWYPWGYQNQILNEILILNWTWEFSDGFWKISKDFFLSFCEKRDVKNQFDLFDMFSWMKIL